MPGARAEYERLGWLLSNGKIPNDEPCKLVLPRIDAKDRIKNPNKNKRIVIVTDDFGYSRFHARREAWLRALDNNPTLFMAALDKAMEEFNVLGWKEEQDAPGEGSLSDA